MPKREKCLATGKRRYTTQEKALDHLEAIRKLPVRPAIIPTRAYECDHCDGWHLTSTAAWEGVLVERKDEFKKYLQ